MSYSVSGKEESVFFKGMAWKVNPASVQGYTLRSTCVAQTGLNVLSKNTKDTMMVRGEGGVDLGGVGGMNMIKNIF